MSQCSYITMDGQVWNTNPLLRDTNVSIRFKMECTEWPCTQYSHNQMHEPMAININTKLIHRADACPLPGSMSLS